MSARPLRSIAGQLYKFEINGEKYRVDLSF
jgi:hypothetical protein